MHRWYRQLQAIELSRLATARPEEIATRIERLGALDHEVSQVTVPPAFRDELYNLRLHIDLVRKHLERFAQRHELRADDPGAPVVQSRANSS